jgi:mannan endo-1,4-beta-mannosidase
MAADDASVPMLTDAAVADAGAAAEPERAMDVGLVVRYRALNTDPSDSVISFALQVVNRSASAPVPLSQLTLRYYFANEHPEVCPKECVVEGFYAGIQPAGQAISARRTHGADPDDPMRAYVEITFPGSSIALGVGESVEVQQQFHTEPYRPLDERNDYSFRRVPDSLQEWDHVTLRQDGVLVWGVLPD